MREIAFVRSWAEGLDLSAAWNRYLRVDTEVDARRARSELQRLLDEMRSQARAWGRDDIAALLRRDPEAIADPTPRRPTLDEFREQAPADFYSEAELLEVYAARFGPPDSRSPARRRQRLRERLVEAVQWLERQSAREPRRADAVSAWLEAPVARRLEAAGVHSLDALMSRIGSKGFRWHQGVARLGPQGAARIVRWLQEHAASLGALPAHALLPARRLDPQALSPPPRPGIVPIERFRPPSALDGSAGLNRAPAAQCRLGADTDLRAVEAWLNLREPGTHTWRAYRREAERFLLWSVVERGKALSSLDADDCRAYRDFLADPAPAWRAPRRTQRWSEAWRPVEGPLAAASQTVALTLVRSLCAWLVQQRYLAANPWDGVALRPLTADRAASRGGLQDASPGSTRPALRALGAEEWRLVERWLSLRAPSPADRRLRFILQFTCMTGLRLSELAGARVERLRHEPRDAGGAAWWLRIDGRRGPGRELPLSEAAVESFREHLTDRGLDPRILSNDPMTPLIARLDGAAALSAARLYELVVQAFGECSASFAGTAPAAAKRLREASTQWLRHTHGAQAAAGGTAPEILQSNMGHASRATTAIYFRGLRVRRGGADRASRQALQRSK